MGVFRTFLALMVAAIHTQIPLFGSIPFDGNGHVPVNGFFAISGFYMALVLDRKYLTYSGGVADFLANRALRIYPSYFFILALSVVLAAVSGSMSFGYWGQSLAKVLAAIPELTGASQALVAFVNLTTFGAHALVETGFLPTGEWSSEIGAAGFVPARFFMLFPPAWTLGIELTFYLLAPLLMWSRWTRLAIPVLAVAFWFYNFAQLGPMTYTQILILPGPAAAHPWVLLETFLPQALFFCYCGMLAYFAYKHLPPALRSPWIGRGLLALLLAYAAVSNVLPFPKDRVIEVYLLLIWVSIPFLFAAFRGSRIDYFIGNLSYAVYVSHFVAYKALAHFIGPAALQAKFFYATLFALALFIVFAIEQPIDRIRERRVARRRQAAGISRPG
ncbi:MAG: acyltransferase family protein [Rhodospirillales bacterium]